MLPQKRLYTGVDVGETVIGTPLYRLFPRESELRDATSKIHFLGKSRAVIGALDRGKFMVGKQTIAYQALSSTQPAYLNSMLTPTRNSRQLRSTSSNPLHIPRVKTKPGTRAFSVAAPTVWNSLPASVKSQGNIVSFRRHLKTYLFNAAYPP